MKEVTAKLMHLRIAPRKVRILTDLLRKMSLAQAKLQLKEQPKRAALPLLKLLISAEANAKHNFSLDPEKLYIKSFTVDEGRALKRSLPRAMGRASLIKKRSSHVKVVLSEKPARGKKTK